VSVDLPKGDLRRKTIIEMYVNMNKQTKMAEHVGNEFTVQLLRCSEESLRIQICIRVGKQPIAVAIS
jgi:tRNA(Glu) U13 pseudouridine synthase TruD